MARSTQVRALLVLATLFAGTGTVAGGELGSDTTLAYRNVGADFAIAAPGANAIIADDLVPGVAFGCPLDSYTLTVTGDVNDPTGGTEAYEVRVALYEICPGAQPTERLIAGTDRTFTLPAGGVHPLTVQIPSQVELALPGAVYLGVRFDRDGCGVMGGAPTEFGYSDDRFHTPDQPCDSTLGGYPSSPHASFVAEIHVRGACDPIHVVYRNSMQAAPAVQTGGGNATLLDDLIPTDRSCELYGAETTIANFGFYQFFLGTERIDTLRWTSFNNASTGRTVARRSFDPATQFGEATLFWMKVNNPDGGILSAPALPSVGASLPGTGFRPNDLSPVGRQDTPVGLDLTLFCKGAAPVGACCDEFWRDQVGAPTCREVPQHACANASNWRQGVTCEQAEAEGCLLGSCCTSLGTCTETNEADCLSGDASALFSIGQDCSGDGVCSRNACARAPRDCAEADPLCADDTCCSIVCEQVGLRHCCTTGWTSDCDDAAAALCPAALNNDECAGPLPYGGAARMGLDESIDVDLSGSTASAEDPLLCCDPVDPFTQPSASRWVVFEESPARTPSALTLSLCALDEQTDADSVRAQFFRVAGGTPGTCTDGSPCNLGKGACVDGSVCYLDRPTACGALERIGCVAAPNGTCESGLPGWTFPVPQLWPGETIFVQLSTVAKDPVARIRVEQQVFPANVTWDESTDCDRDGLPDVCELGPFVVDLDSDGVPAECDNCPSAFNPDQLDGDSDSIGDACDNCPNVGWASREDSDGDGLGDGCDNCPKEFNPDQWKCNFTFALGDACVDTADPSVCSRPGFASSICEDCNDNKRFDLCETFTLPTSAWVISPENLGDLADLRPDGAVAYMSGSGRDYLLARMGSDWTVIAEVDEDLHVLDADLSDELFVVLLADFASTQVELVLFDFLDGDVGIEEVFRYREPVHYSRTDGAGVSADGRRVAYSFYGDSKWELRVAEPSEAQWEIDGSSFFGSSSDRRTLLLDGDVIWAAADGTISMFDKSPDGWIYRSLHRDYAVGRSVAVLAERTHANGTISWSLLTPYELREDLAGVMQVRRSELDGRLEVIGPYSTNALLDSVPFGPNERSLLALGDMILLPAQSYLTPPGSYTVFDMNLAARWIDDEWIVQGAYYIPYPLELASRFPIALNDCRTGRDVLVCIADDSLVTFPFIDIPPCPYDFVVDECQDGTQDDDEDGFGNDCDNCPQVFNPEQRDCDFDGIGDVCVIADGVEDDCDGDGIPDNCELDCNENGTPDECESIGDCDGNGIPDSCDVRTELVQFSPLAVGTRGLFGLSVDISGDRLLVASPLADVLHEDIEPECNECCPGDPYRGAVHFYELDGATWQPIFTQLRGCGDSFYNYASVAIDGGRAFAGAAIVEESTGWDYDAETLFYQVDFEFGRITDLSGDIWVGGGKRYGTWFYGWTPTGNVGGGIARPSGNTGSGFGVGVGTDGVRFIVGQVEAEEGVLETGSAFIYEPNFVDPPEAVAELRSPDPCGVDEFGLAVDVYGDTAVVGAPGSGCGDRRGGAVYVFLRAGDAWAYSHTLQAPISEWGDRFGFALDLEGDRLLVGAPERGIGGRVLLFERTGDAFRFAREYAPPVPQDGGRFGMSVAISGSRFAVGAPGWRDVVYDAGAAFVGHVDAGDCDGDDIPDRCERGDIDGEPGFGSADFKRWFECASGPCNTLACAEAGLEQACCTPIDADRDGDYDLRDFSLLAQDSDRDGIPDALDDCPFDASDDSDGDRVCDSDDRCPGFDDSIDEDGDEIPDACDACPIDAANDSDGDGRCESDDNCPDASNAEQTDQDQDGVGDICDPCPLDADNDADADTVCGDVDRCPGFDDRLDADSDGIPDDCDTCPLDTANDADLDGVCNDIDECSATPLNAPVFANGCAIELPSGFLSTGPLTHVSFVANTIQTPIEYRLLGDGQLHRALIQVDPSGVLSQFSGVVEIVATEVPPGSSTEILRVAEVFGEPEGLFVQTLEFEEFVLVGGPEGTRLRIVYHLTERLTVGSEVLAVGERTLSGEVVTDLDETSTGALQFVASEGSYEVCNDGICFDVDLTIDRLGGPFTWTVVK